MEVPSCTVTPTRESFLERACYCYKGAIMAHIKGDLNRLWECKHCHRLITDDENVAYHLIDRALYGWCEPCFRRRNKSEGK